MSIFFIPLLLINIINIGCCECNGFLYSYDQKFPDDIYIDKNKEITTFIKEYGEGKIEKKDFYRITHEYMAIFKFVVEKYLLFIGEQKIPASYVREYDNSTEKVESKFKNSKKPLLVYFHGVGDTIFNVLKKIETTYFKYLLNTYDLLIVELPGYNINNKNDFSKNTRNKHIADIHKFLEEKWEKKYIIVGYSLGCHFALLLTKEGGKKPEHLFLLNPQFQVLNLCKLFFCHYTHRCFRFQGIGLKTCCMTRYLKNNSCQ